MFEVLNYNSVPLKRFYPTTPQVNFYEIRGKKFVYDSNSMCLVEVGSELFETLKKTDVDKFKGLLFCNIAPQFPFYPRAPVKKLVMNITHGCNLNCSYCFVGSCYEEGHKSNNMTLDIAKKAINRFSTDQIDIGFFGGEPLLNWELIKDVVEYVKQKGYKEKRPYYFHITTNGTLLDKEKVDFLNENEFSVILSLDGPEEIHNKHRPSSRFNSWAETVKALQYFKNRPIAARTTLRSTYTGKNPQVVERLEYLNDLCDSGFASWVSVEPVCLTEAACVRIEDVHPDSISLSNLQNDEFWYNEISRAADWIIERFKAGKQARYHNIFKFIERILWNHANPSECGAGRGYMAVNGAGEVFACHREYLSQIGDLQFGLDEPKQAKWLDNRLYARPICSKCDIRYVCGGGCRLENIAFDGDINTPEPTACWFKKTYFEQAVYVISECKKEMITKFIENPHKKERALCPQVNRKNLMVKSEQP